MSTQEAAPCGTYPAYQAHRKRHEEPCDPCRAALAAYQRTYRRANPALYARNLAAGYARERALARLAREYPERFTELLNEERLPVYRADSA